MFQKEEFIDILSAAVEFTSSDPAAAGLDVVLFEFTDDNTLRIVSTCGHRMLTVELTCSTPVMGGAISFTVPEKEIAAALGILRGSNGAEIVLTPWAKELIISCGDNMAPATIWESNDFPDYKALLARKTGELGTASIDGALLPGSCAIEGVSSKAHITTHGPRDPMVIGHILFDHIKSIKSVTAHIMPFKL